MKKSLIIMLLVTGLSAQGGFTIVGGLNMGSTKFNDSDIADEIDLFLKLGLSVGAETMVGSFKVGGAFVQRGSKLEIDLFDEKLEGSDTYNYLTGYGLYPYSINEGLAVFGGFQLGTFIGGKSEITFLGESESEDLEADNFALDYGLLLGVDYMVNANIGVRASYYLGLADVAKDVESDLNFKNTGIGIALLYKR